MLYKLVETRNHYERNNLNIILMFFLNQCPDSPSGMERADLYRNNHSLYIKRCQYFTKKFSDPSLPYKEYDCNWDFSLTKEIY